MLCGGPQSERACAPREISPVEGDRPVVPDIPCPEGHLLPDLSPLGAFLAHAARKVRLMPAPTPSIDPSTLKFARTLVRIKARQITRRAPGDRDDVEQTLLLEVLLRWPGYDAARGTREAFVEQIVRGKVCKLLRARKRRRATLPLTEAALRMPDPRDPIRDAALRMDVQVIVERLPPGLREACDQLRRETQSGTARVMGVNPSTSPRTSNRSSDGATNCRRILSDASSSDRSAGSPSPARW